MKTIFRTNRPQNKYIGFSLLLLIAVFGLFIGGVKPPTGDVTAPSIGGNGTVSIPGPTPIAAAMHAEIGGQHVPRDTSPMGYSSVTEIGGQRVPGGNDPLGMVNHLAIGGQGVPGPETRAVFGIKVTDIGGNGSAVPTPTLPIIIFQKTEIGGGSAPQENRGRSGNENVVIGGNQGAPQVPGLPLTTVEFNEIGGNGTPTPRLSFIGFVVQDKTEIGGNQSLPQPNLPLVKEAGNLNASMQIAFKPTCMQKYSVFDFNEEFASAELPEIGGAQSVPRENKDIGGGQTAPREAKEIGGQQGAPRP